MALEAAVDAACINGVWQSDSSQHAAAQQVNGGPTLSSPIRVSPREGRATLRVCYFFSGVSRKTSIAQHLLEMCEAEGVGLEIEEVDIHIGGQAHDLLNTEAQENILARIDSGYFNLVI